jgi:hypothetical protein
MHIRLLGRLTASTAITRGIHTRRAIAREWFDHRGVLGAMLDHLDCKPAPLSASA